MKSILFLTLLMSSTAFGTDFGQYLADYELVAASQTAQVMGPGSATTKQGDILETLLIVPETLAAGTVAIKDGADTAINVFVAGTLTDLHPIVIRLGARSHTGSWQVTTGANVHVIAVGRFK
jgi:hypothetical protein